MKSQHPGNRWDDPDLGRELSMLRDRANLTQKKLSVQLRVSDVTIRKWESGTKPNPEHLRNLIGLYLNLGVLTKGREREEAKALWEKAELNPAFDEAWFKILMNKKLEVAPVETARIQSETPLLASHVALITASLDPHDSWYVQEREQEETIIHYQGPRERGMYHFPTFDCKFQNGGMATAAMWQLGIEILSATVDPTPVFVFEASIEDQGLQLVATNPGWGAAYDCEIQVHEPTLDQLVGDAGHCSAGTMYSGERRILLTLTKDHINLTQFAALSRDIIDYFSERLLKQMKHIEDPFAVSTQEEREYLQEMFQENARTILLLIDEPASPERLEAVYQALKASKFSPFSSKELPGIIGKRLIDLISAQEELQLQLDITYKWKDETGCSHEGRTQIPLTCSFEGKRVALSTCFLTQNGFRRGAVSFRNSIPVSSMSSDLTYIALIDPSRGSHERQYPIARQIPSGDVERFHVMIGASMSCHLLIRFKFFLDQTTLLLSETFDLQIWNPRDAQWHTRYKDAGAIQRDIREDIQEKVERGEWTGWELDIVPDWIADYPFITYGPNFSCLSKDVPLSQEGYQGALLAFEQIIQIDSTFAPAYLGKGHILMRLGRRKEALQAYKKAKQLGAKTK